MQLLEITSNDKGQLYTHKSSLPNGWVFLKILRDIKFLKQFRTTFIWVLGFVLKIVSQHQTHDMQQALDGHETNQLHSGELQPSGRSIHSERSARHHIHVRSHLQSLHASQSIGHDVHGSGLQSQMQDRISRGQRGRHDKVFQHGNTRASWMDEGSWETDCELECASDRWRYGHFVLGRFGSTVGFEDVRVQAET